jgi:hypothetical protein
MSLPGLGVFTLDKSVILPEENDRALLSMPNAVQFQNANIVAAEKELITFICENTGKIKPLAISDLDSYLNLGTEMLNIGKPFYLEGIGTITKNKAGKFDFSPGEYSLIKENSASSDHGKKKIYARDKKPLSSSATVQNRNGLKVLALISALIIVGLGGWMMYKRNSPAVSENTADTSVPLQPQQQPATDSLKKDSVRLDSVKIPAPVIAHPLPDSKEGVNYKFVILVTNDKGRAMKRYNQLIGFDLKAHYYHADSTYRVYFQFPALAKDTVHIKDSLRKEYAHNVIIEKE